MADEAAAEPEHQEGEAPEGDEHAAEGGGEEDTAAALEKLHSESAIHALTEEAYNEARRREDIMMRKMQDEEEERAGAREVPAPLEPCPPWPVAVLKEVAATCGRGGLCYTTQDLHVSFAGTLQLRATCFRTGEQSVILDHPVAFYRGSSKLHWVPCEAISGLSGTTHLLEAVVFDSHGHALHRQTVSLTSLNAEHLRREDACVWVAPAGQQPQDAAVSLGMQTAALADIGTAAATLLPAAGGFAAVAASSAVPPTPSERDVAFEDELLQFGSSTDVVFQFMAEGGGVEEIFGHAGVLGFISPVLREILATATVTAKTARGARIVTLDQAITAAGFREVVRYTYRLPLRLTAAHLAEVVAAARLLRMPELEKASVGWGLDSIARNNRQVRFEDDGGTRGDQEPWQIADVFRCLEEACREPPPPVPQLYHMASRQAEREAVVSAWREKLVLHWHVPEILAHPALLELSVGALRKLLLQDELHSDVDALWLAAAAWARAQEEAKVPLPAHLADAAAAAAAPPSPQRGPRKLFGAGAPAMVAAVPPPPPLAGPEADWQRRLLPVVELLRLENMSPASFAQHVEGLDPILPDLRLAIYAARRRGAAAGAATSGTLAASGLVA